MRKNRLLAVLFSAVLLLCPLPLLREPPPNTPSASVPTAVSEPDLPEQFRIFDPGTDKTVVLSAQDYIRGVVAAEMPALYEPEALKAQAVAAYTFACRRKEMTEKKYDLSTDHTVDQSYQTDEQLRVRWGDDADLYLKKINDAVAAVAGELVTYNGSPALTVYHSVSSGKTESAEDVWGTALPYLVSVDSTCDRDAKGYETKVNVTEAQARESLNKLCKLSGNPSEWFGKPTRTAGGAVAAISVCGTELTGNRLRETFGLRSANFSVSCTADGLCFTVHGYGHGVGMSQNGANELAKQGKSYRDILLHYYPGCTVTAPENDAAFS